MRNRTIRLVIILATLAILGIVPVQVYWVRRAFSLTEQQFAHDVNLALRRVSERLIQYNGHAVPLGDPIRQAASNYYLVAVNDAIDANLLEFLLRDEFSKRNLRPAFEYGIYDCSSDRMVYGRYVNGNPEAGPRIRRTDLPKWEAQTYYFGVYFPNRQSFLAGQMEIWAFSSFVLLVVVVFFAYASFVILRQKRLSEIQKDFIANMTHEFKTPIATIALSAEVLRQPNIGQSPERLLNYATLIGNEAQRLTGQVERVLRIARLEREGLTLKLESVDVHQLIEEAVAQQAAALQQAGGQLQLELRASPAIIRADALHLANVFSNLLDNALKYCQQAPVIVIRTASHQGKLHLSVQDNGIGIPPAAHKLVFKQFYRVSTGYVHNVKGFGLGLYYVQRLVQAHRGRLRLESQPGNGSTFHLSFPVNLLENRKRHILLAEDDPSLGFVIRENLENRGFAVTLCPDGEVALATFQPGAFDACVLDVMMPRRDGFAVAAGIRQLDPWVPIYVSYCSLVSGRPAGGLSHGRR